MHMEYADEDIDFAFRILNERETLDDQAVAAWLKSASNRRLMNEMEGVRQEWERETADGEAARERRAKEAQAGRRATLKRTVILLIAMVALLMVYKIFRG